MPTVVVEKQVKSGNVRGILIYSMVVTAGILAKVSSDNSLAPVHFFITPTPVAGHLLPKATVYGLSKIYS